MIDYRASFGPAAVHCTLGAAGNHDTNKKILNQSCCCCR